METGKPISRKLILQATLAHIIAALAALVIVQAAHADFSTTPTPSTQVSCGGRGGLNGIAPGLYSNETGSPILKLIQGATAQLDIEIYTMDDANVRSAIRTAMSCGVKVRVVKEPEPLGGCAVFKSGSTEANCLDQQKLVQEVISSGGQFVAFDKDNLCPEPKKSCFEHGKIAIADSSVALVSTGNFDPTSLCDVTQDPSTCDRDYSVITTDADIIKSFGKIVDDDLKGAKYSVADDIDSAAEAKVTVSPLSLSPILAFVGRAKRTIQIQNQYLEDTDWNKALEEASQRGVQIQLNVESFCAFGAPSTSDVTKDTGIFSGFDSAGIVSRIFNKNVRVGNHAGYLHAKTMVIDGEEAWVGSVNGSTTAISNNREFGVFLSDQESVSKLSAIMTADFDNTGEESWQQSLACDESAKTAKAR